jgi:hypothetical protein
VESVTGGRESAKIALEKNGAAKTASPHDAPSVTKWNHRGSAIGRVKILHCESLQEKFCRQRHTLCRGFDGNQAGVESVGKVIGGRRHCFIPSRLRLISGTAAAQKKDSRRCGSVKRIIGSPEKIIEARQVDT